MTAARPLATEGQLVRMLQQALPYALPDVLVFSRPIVNAQATARGNTWRVRAGVPGQADLYAVARGGLHVEIETKSFAGHDRGRLQTAQIAWRRRCQELDIPHLVLRALRGEAPGATVERWVREVRSVFETHPLGRGATDPLQT